MTFQSGGFQPTDAAPDDRLYTSVIPVEPAEHFATYDDLGEVVIVAVAAFLAVGDGLDHLPAD